MEEQVKQPEQEERRGRKRAVVQESITEEPEYKPTYSCLRNEKVFVNLIPRNLGKIKDPKHVLYGNMAETAKKTFCVPLLKNGLYVNVLTNEEKTFLENIMGLEYDALSIYRKKDNFWDCANDLAKVILSKKSNVLDLSSPIDYIKWKILLANKDRIAPSRRALEDYPKATYVFVMTSEAEETSLAQGKLSITMRCYKELGKIENDRTKLKVICELIEGKPLARDTKLIYLQNKADDIIRTNPKLFLQTVTDETLEGKILIKKCVEYNIINKRGNDHYYNGEPLCNSGEYPTLNSAASYIMLPKNQELKFSLEAKVKTKELL